MNDSARTFAVRRRTRTPSSTVATSLACALHLLAHATANGQDAAVDHENASMKAPRISATWAFDPPRAHAPPPVEPAVAQFVRDPIDAFVAAELAAVGLTPSPPADARTLIRRATLDVTGLPPTPEEIAAFVAESRGDGAESLDIEDRANAAYIAWIDRLLASPRYAERSASDWLDLVRFAETNGFEMNQPRPDAWPYRDWVIDAFHRDLPFSEFVRAQIVGDQLGADAATGFLVAGTWDQVKSPDPELTAIQRDDELHGIVATTSAALLGITVGCAKCHDHKFDPIDQRDYFSLRACFEGVQMASRPWLDDVPTKAQEGREPVESVRNVDRFAPIVAQRVRFVVTRTSDAEPCIDELEILAADSEGTNIGEMKKNVALATEGAIARASSIYAGNPRHALEHVNDGRYGNDHSWIAAEPVGFVEIELREPTAIDTVIWGRDRNGEFRDRVATGYRIEAFVETGSGESCWQTVASSDDRRPTPDAAPTVYAGRFDVAPPATRLLDRGDPMEPREVVAPGGVERLFVPFVLEDEDDEPSRRRALADWLTSPKNPLLARVMVNRIWQHHFGRGLVATPSDFGAMGMRPTHPELLDTLARDFQESGWSKKAMHRRILLSSTYRQASAPRQDGQGIDAQNLLLWRFAPRRQPAESIRDSMLAVAGVLDLSMGGPSVSSFAPNENYVRVYEPKVEFDERDFRRSIYLLRVRMHPEPTFAAFDLPDGGQPCPRRGTAVTPHQALALTHAPFVLDLSRRFAARLELEKPEGLEPQLVRMFELAFGRAPTDSEFAASLSVVRDHGLAMGCRAILGASEFQWIE